MIKIGQIGIGHNHGEAKMLTVRKFPQLFEVVCFAFLFFKNEKFSIIKIIGAIVGFGGIVAIIYNSSGIRFAVGDILIIGASICTVIANVISKKSVQGSSPYWITGISQLFGGVVLFIAAIIMGADFLTFDLNATLFLLIFVSHLFVHILCGTMYLKITAFPKCLLSSFQSHFSLAYSVRLF